LASNVQYQSILAMLFNEIKCHVNTSLGLVGGDASPASLLCPRLLKCLILCWERISFQGYCFPRTCDIRYFRTDSRSTAFL